MSTRNILRWFEGTLAVIALAVLSAGSVEAQTSTGTIRGTITGANGAGVSDAQVSARNVETGVVRSTTSRDGGFYVLPGLAPATYDMTVRRIGTASVTRRVVVQIGAVQIQNFSLVEQATQLERVVVSATAAP